MTIRTFFYRRSRFVRLLFVIAAPAILLVPVYVGALGIQVMVDGRAVTFVDVPQTAWFSGYIRESAEAGIVNGYKNVRGELTGVFGPGNSITLAEALKIAVEGAGYDEGVYGAMVESGINHWASPYVAVAKAEQFALLDSRTRVRWDAPATRAEVSSFFTSAFDVDTESMTDIGYDYSDVSSSTEFGASIEALTRASVVSGDTDVRGNLTGTFRPASPINRAEVVKMVIEARAEFGMPGNEKRPSESSESTTETYLVTYRDGGFEPKVIRIKNGESVRFHNTVASGMWVASNPHPAHTGYEGFDEKMSVEAGGDYIFTFRRTGTWGYHNHLRASHTGTVVVE